MSDDEMAKMLQTMWCMLRKFTENLDTISLTIVNDRCFHMFYDRTRRRHHIKTDLWSSVQGLNENEDIWYNELLGYELFVPVLVKPPENMKAFERDFLFVQLASA